MTSAAVDAVVGDRVVRFDRTERWLHWTNALLFLTLLVSGMALYIGPIGTLGLPRHLVKDVHVAVGLALPAPLVLAYAGRWRAGLRRDVRRLARWSTDDRRWLLSGGRRGRSTMGKFNAGQKLNAAFTAGAILVMLGTGEIMTFPDPWGDRWRTGATFVHDWLFLLIAVVAAGHLWEALRDRDALGGMLTGRVDRGWAARHHAAWADAEPAEDRPEERPGEAGPEFAKRRPGTS